MFEILPVPLPGLLRPRCQRSGMHACICTYFPECITSSRLGQPLDSAAQTRLQLAEPFTVYINTVPPPYLLPGSGYISEGFWKLSQNRVAEQAVPFGDWPDWDASERGVWNGRAACWPMKARCWMEEFMEAS